MTVREPVGDARVSVVHARARIDLDDTADRGLSKPMLSPYMSLILRVEHDVPDEDVNLGVQITTASGEPLSPGASDPTSSCTSGPTCPTWPTCS